MNKIIAITLFGLFSVFNSIAQEQDTVLYALMPKIPASIAEPSLRANYLALHYWDNFNFLDSVKLKQNKLLERGFADFIDLLSMTSKETTELAIKTLMKKAEIDPDLIITFALLSEKYLYEPDSPLSDDEKYILFMRYMINSPKVAEDNKIRPKFMLDCVLKNRKGEVASDFTYTQINGDTGTLHGIEADYTLLFFKNPTCEECNKLTKKLIFSSTVNDLINRGDLKVLTVYLLDETDEWINHASSVLHSWIYARDAEGKINAKGIYNIKRYPTIYLLDKDKKVILKDTDYERIEKYLNEKDDGRKKN
jgi:thioredoxin-related protein